MTNAPAPAEWPPDSDWTFRQKLIRVVWLHSPVDAGALRPLVPAGIEIETFAGSAWVSLVALQMDSMQLHGVPAIPVVDTCPEVETRTYVRGGRDSGVWFFSIDSPGHLRSWLGRHLLHLPWQAAAVQFVEDGEQTRFASRRDSDGAAFRATYRPAGEALTLQPGDLDEFLADRNVMFGIDGQGHLLATEVLHRSWSPRPGEVEVEENTLWSALGLDVPLIAALVRYADSDDSVAWRAQRV